jgi:uncharacterized protein (TIGR02145 family)
MDPCAGVTLAANQFCDSRDGEVYRTTKSGPWSDSQTWMAENLRFDAKTQGNCGSATSQVACMSICYSNIPANCENKYGRLYDYATALQIATAYNAVTLTRTSILQGICPEGWHLPSANEWSDLVRRTGQWYSTYDAYTIAKAFKASTGWNTSVGDDVFAFTALPAGTSYWVQIGGSGYGMQVGRGTKAYFLALDGDEADMMTAYIFSDDNNQIVHSLGYMQPKEYGVSVRCVRDTL